jgi:hypothetical protein
VSYSSIAQSDCSCVGVLACEQYKAEEVGKGDGIFTGDESKVWIDPLCGGIDGVGWSVCHRGGVDCDNHWWVFYHLQDESWEELIGFLSYGRHTVLPVEHWHGRVMDVAPAVNHQVPVLLVVEEDDETRWWLLYLEYPEVGSRHVFRYILLRSLLLDLSVPIVVVDREETEVEGDAGEEDSDDPWSGWLLESSDVE